MRLHKEQEAICRRLNDPSGLAISSANQAQLLAFKLLRLADALPLVEEALRLVVHLVSIDACCLWVHRSTPGKKLPKSEVLAKLLPCVNSKPSDH